MELPPELLWIVVDIVGRFGYPYCDRTVVAMCRVNTKWRKAVRAWISSGKVNDCFENGLRISKDLASFVVNGPGGGVYLGGKLLVGRDLGKWIEWNRREWNLRTSRWETVSQYKVSMMLLSKRVLIEYRL